MDEQVRRSQTDESRVLLGEAGGMAKGDFNLWFAGFVASNFALGGGIGLLIYCVIRFPRIVEAFRVWGSAPSSGFGM